MKKRRKRDIPGDEAKMRSQFGEVIQPVVEKIEQSPLEVGFILPIFFPKQLAFSSVGESDRAVRFFFSFSEGHISSPNRVRIPLQGVKGAIKARLEHASLKKNVRLSCVSLFFRRLKAFSPLQRLEARIKARLENAFENFVPNSSQS